MVVERSEDFVARGEELGLAGVVAKRLGSTYIPRRRRTAWVKHKLRREKRLAMTGVRRNEIELEGEFLAGEAAPDHGLQPPQRHEHHERDHGRGQRPHVEPRGGGHPDRRRDPQCRGRGDAADGDSVPQDHPGAQEPDPGHHLGRDPRWIDPRVAELGKPVGGDQREQARPEAHDHVGAQPRDLVSRLPLEPDRAAQYHHDRQPQHDLAVGAGSSAHEGRVLDAYYDLRPDPSMPGQRVAFGTSGHRGTSLASTFNEAHVLVIAEAVCRYRAWHGVDRPLFLGRDTHPTSARTPIAVPRL